MASTAVTPPALTALVLCKADHKLTGLYVLFKLLAPGGEAPAQKLARVLESTPHPGEPPAEPTPTGNATKDKAAKKEYDKRKKAHDEALKKHEAWKETPPDPADRFVLGFVDDDGFLQPVHASSNPWLDAATRRDPDTYKLAAGEKYSVCALRHPSPALARALGRYLNHEKAAPGDEQWHFASWGELTREVVLEKITVGGGEQVVLRLSEDPQDYVPRGSARYGQWVLYRDMPHRQCAGVAAEVQKLMVDMGKLGYPVGTIGKPFEPREEEVLDLSRTAPKGKKVTRFEYDGQVQACTARLHEHAAAGKSFVLALKDKAQGGHVWARALGEPLAFDPASKPESEPDTAKRALRWAPLPKASVPGVVDEETANLIAHWVDKGLRKPAEVLIDSVTWDIWMLERGAIALEAWSELAKVFGCQYGVKGGSSFRSVNVGAWPGAIMNSVHKTGLAVDLAGGGNREASKSWPIRYEVSWRKDEKAGARRLKDAQAAVDAAETVVKDKQALLAAKGTETDAKKLAAIDKKLKSDTYTNAETNLEKKKKTLEVVKNDDNDGKLLDWTQRWRLYGHSDLDIFGAGRAAALERLRAKIADYAGLPWPLPAPQAGAAPAPTRGALWKTLAQKHFKGVEGPAVEAYLDRIVAPFAAYAAELVALSDQALIEGYFRLQVVQFDVNPYESDGGSPGKVYGPSDADGDFPAAPFAAKSWVNLSALGYPCQMERIPPHKNDIRDQTWIRGPEDARAAPKAWPMAAYFTVADAEDQDLVLMLSDISASEAEAPQLKQRDTDIPILRDGAEIAVHEPADIDGTFVKAWRDEIRGLDASLRPSPKRDGKTDPRGAQIALVLSATDKGKQPLLAAIGKLRGSFGDKSFVVMHAGELAKVGAPAGEIVKGRALADALDKAIADFTAQATANAKAAADAAAAAAAPDAKPPPPKTKAQIQAEKKAAAEAAAAGARKTAADWTVVIQPIFVKKPDPALITFLPEDRVKLPPGSNANHLEWWHYQHRSAGPNWGALLSECGFSLAVMGTPRAGADDAAASPVHRGLGYTAKDIASSPGAFNEGPVENRDGFTPAGV